MKYWKLRDADTLLPASFAAEVMAGVGDEKLASHVLNAMQRLLPVSHCTVFALGADGRVSAISTASLYGEAATMTAVEYVRQGFDRQDSNMVWLAKRKTPQRSKTWLSHQLAEEVADEHYRKVCYGENGIRERVSVLLVLEDGNRVAISFYRNFSFAPFTEEDLTTIRDCAPFLMAAVSAHVRLVHRDSLGTALHQKILTLLPHRERQVISHILAGQTTKEAAHAMQLSTTTVLTYRYRAFAKLGIRTQRELLAMLDKWPAVVAEARSI